MALLSGAVTLDHGPVFCIQMNIVLIGFTSCGKSAAGQRLAQDMGLTFLDLDDEIEDLSEARTGARRRCREIYREEGADGFRSLETDALIQVSSRDNVILATGGGAPVAAANQTILARFGTCVYLRAAAQTILARMQDKGMPAFIAADPTIENLTRVMNERDAVYAQVADHTIDTDERSPEAVAKAIGDRLGI